MRDATQGPSSTDRSVEPGPGALSEQKVNPIITQPQYAIGTVYNPYMQIPAIGLVWHALYSLGAETGQAQLQIGIRDLAQRAGVSPGSIPRLLRRLVDEQQLASYDPTTSTIELCLINPLITMAIKTLIDQSFDQASDQNIDRAVMPNDEKQAIKTLIDQSFDQASDQRIDRAVMPQNGPANEPPDLDLDQIRSEDTCDPALVAYLGQVGNLNQSVIDGIQQHAIGTLAEFEADLALARRAPKIRNPLIFVASCWQQGRRATLPQAQENSHEKTAQRRSRSAAPRANAGRAGRRNENPEQQPRLAERPGLDLAALGLDMFV